jgi:hypothetical protein
MCSDGRNEANWRDFATESAGAFVSISFLIKVLSAEVFNFQFAQLNVKIVFPDMFSFPH